LSTDTRETRSQTFAPWAEVVPDTEPATVDSLLTLPDDGWQYEVVEGVYRFPGAETALLPDVGFYGAALFPYVTDRDKPVPFAPELAVEVASPSQDAGDMAAKAARYLRGGTRLVWVVWPHTQTVDVWHAGDLRPRPEDMRSSTTLHATAGAAFDGEDVVPGFSHPVADIFDV
jgi:Uma2 family endonuclease